jgi:hypothetical protein
VSWRKTSERVRVAGARHSQVVYRRSGTDTPGIRVLVTRRDGTRAFVHRKLPRSAAFTSRGGGDGDGDDEQDAERGYAEQAPDDPGRQCSLDDHTWLPNQRIVNGDNKLIGYLPAPSCVENAAWVNRYVTKYNKDNKASTAFRHFAFRALGWKALGSADNDENIEFISGFGGNGWSGIDDEERENRIWPLLHRVYLGVGSNKTAAWWNVGLTPTAGFGLGLDLDAFKDMMTTLARPAKRPQIEPQVAADGAADGDDGTRDSSNGVAADGDDHWTRDSAAVNANASYDAANASYDAATASYDGANASNDGANASNDDCCEISINDPNDPNKTAYTRRIWTKGNIVGDCGPPDDPKCPRNGGAGTQRQRQQLGRSRRPSAGTRRAGKQSVRGQTTAKKQADTR